MDAVKLLVAHGADIEATDKVSTNAMVAISRAVVEILVVVVGSLPLLSRTISALEF
jgi:predicted Fe-Mo cluster-binding NifX family protein